MIFFSGYEKFTSIYNGENSQVYRAIRQSDRLSVILKILKVDYPTPEQLRRYKQEYNLAHQLNLPRVIKAYGLEKWQKTLIIVFEDFGAISLNHLLTQYAQGIPIDLFLPLSLEITEALAQLHSQNIIHKDINPSNIIINPETMELKLIDLGISTQLSRENHFLQSPHNLEGTLSYISPEQTGRMNRVLDYRSDFYSLGVTFYELLTGFLPFSTNDPLELVHCHIAKEAISLLEVKKGEISPTLANIVSKLMAKNPEERYQSAWGLRTDLEECLQQWQKTGKIIEFNLGEKDICDRFQIPQKLYGREKEISRLINAFERVANSSQSLATSQLMLVSGYSGIGKSALVRSLYQPITEKRGYFIWGKFDQFQKNIPYSALVNAFSDLVKQLLTESQTMLEQWREKILTALGNNARVVIDVIPDLELIIGTQPPIPKLDGSEAQNRFNLVFQNFIQAFCTSEHPLVIFLDDLQWIDLATLNLLESLLGKSKIKYLLLIIAYRDNEVDDAHPLTLTLKKLQRQSVNVEKITLNPLSLEQVIELIANTLDKDRNQVKDLAKLIIRKTQGNPFFTEQFITNLYKENLLTFNHHQREWQWDIEQIERMEFTDNVVELMVEKLKKLPTS
ncbi:MAG: AAA family ATPase, partial [Crocosphaera sp.]|nr:AAA family ATPase [Crocosphaera sp.]